MPSPSLPLSIRSIPLLADVAEQEKDALLAQATVRHLSRGEALFQHGDVVTHLFVVIEGTVQLFRTTPQGTQKVMMLATYGQTLCEDEILDACSRQRVSAYAVSDAILLAFPASWLTQSARHCPTFALNLLASLSERARMAELEAEHQATLSATQMVACFLQRLCVIHHLDPHGFELPYSKVLIASRLGLEPETFSRTLGKLKEYGIAVQGQHVVIHDIDRINQYVCEFCSISGECTTHQTVAAALKTPHTT